MQALVRRATTILFLSAMVPTLPAVLTAPRHKRTLLDGNFPLSRQEILQNFNVAAAHLLVALPFIPYLVLPQLFVAAASPGLLALNDRFSSFVGQLGSLFPSQNGDSAPQAQPSPARLFRRSAPPAPFQAWPNIMDMIVRMEAILQRLNANGPECGSLTLCESMKQLLPTGMGRSVAQKLEVDRLEAELDLFPTPPSTKQMLKTLMKASIDGLHQRNCPQIYQKCSFG